jgi:hypothetical protein
VSKFALTVLLLAVAISSAVAVENDYFRNGGSDAAAVHGLNNGVDLWSLNWSISGFPSDDSGSGLFRNPSAAVNFGPLVAPSDLPDLSSYDSDFWTNEQTTLLGESVALRLEVVEMRRLVLIALGCLCGLVSMQVILRGVGL